MNKISREDKQKSFGFSFLQKFIPLALLTGLIFGIPSFSRGDSITQIKVTAIVLPKTSFLDYKRLHEDIIRRMEEYSREVRIGNQEKVFKATVNLDFLGGSQGIVIERVEHKP